MDTRTLRIFQQEINKQCEFALISASSISNQLSNPTIDSPVNHLWYFVQNFLISNANISKLLWGSNGTDSMNRKPLRDSLNIADDSLLKSKKVRNLFEHFDEKIDDWSRNSRSKNFIDSNVMPLSMLGTSFDTKDIFRNLDPKTLTLTFWNEVYEIQPIVEELIELKKLSDIESNKSSSD